MTEFRARVLKLTVLGHEFEILDYPESTTAEMTRDELEQLSLLNQLPEDFDGYIFDVGANIGLYTMLASRLYPKSKIVSLEPVPDTFALLNENLIRNKITNVTTVNAGLSNLNEIFRIGVNPQNPGGASFLHTGVFDSVECRGITFDALLRGLKLETIKVGLLKLDVEGMEYLILDSFSGEDWNKIERLDVELHGFHQLPVKHNRMLYADLCHWLSDMVYLNTFKHSEVFGENPKLVMVHGPFDWEIPESLYGNLGHGYGDGFFNPFNYSLTFGDRRQ